MRVTEVPPGSERALRAAGIEAREIRDVQRLSGGVSGEVWSLGLGDRRVVLKRALAKLATARDWHADAERIRREVIFSEILADVAPENALRIRAFDPAGYVVMDHAPRTARTWKELLLAGEADAATAEAVGSLLKRVHVDGSAHPLAGTLADMADFEALRITPFFVDLVALHPAVTPKLTDLMERLRRPGAGLMHGDFSPKNLLISRSGEVHLIDHEVATWAEPAFDVAFLVSHLFLKALHLRSPDVAGLVPRFTGGYGDADGTVVGDLVVALMLARVDGRSPAGYLDPATRDRVRELCLQWLGRSPVLSQLTRDIEKECLSETH